MAASLPATTTADSRNGASGAPPAHPSRQWRRPWRLSLTRRLGALVALLLALLVVQAVIVLGPLRQDQRGQDAVLSRATQNSLQARRMQIEFEHQRQEWTTVLLRSSNGTALPVYVQRYRDRSTAVTALAGQLQDQIGDTATADLVVAFRDEHQAMNEANDDALRSFVAAGGRDLQRLAAATADRDLGPSDRLVALVDRLDATAQAAQRAALTHQQRLLLLLGALIVVAMLAVSAVVVRGIIRPVRLLAHEADRAARQTLPAILAQVRTLPADAEPPAVAPVDVGTGDELEVVALALHAMHTTAVDLAVRQRRTGRESGQLLINLARRNQNLVEHTRACIEKLRIAQQDPTVAADLERLDRTTSRARRNAESMLVLGGAMTPPRMRTRPVPVAEIVRAALDEIADGARVDLHHVEQAAVVGTAVGDLTHLVAELLENATNFSPPDVRVIVVGRFSSSGRYGLHVVDQGIGMTSSELAAANTWITHGASQGDPDTHRLGLHLAGRLAARLGVVVTLRPSTGRGLTAEVILPAGIIIDIERTEAEHDGWTPSRGSGRVVAAGAAVAPAGRRTPDGPSVAGSPIPSDRGAVGTAMMAADREE